MPRRQNVDVPIPTLMHSVPMSIRKKQFFLNIQNNFNFVFLKKYDNNFLNFFTAPDDPEPIDVDSIPKKDGEKQIERARHPASAQQVAGEKTF